jgi:ligand-binding sensor domain-containing protein
MQINVGFIATLLASALLLAACDSRTVTREATPTPPVMATATPTGSLDPYASVTNLVVAPDGAVWLSFGHYSYDSSGGGGVMRFYDGQVTHFTTKDGLPDDSIQALEAAPDGTIWAGGIGCSVARFDGQTWRTVSAGCDTIGGNVVDFALTPDGSVWAATGLDLVRFDGQSWTGYGRHVSSLAVTPDGTLWAHGWEGAQGSDYLARFEGTDWTVIDKRPAGQLFVGPDGSLWSSQGWPQHLARFDGQTWSGLPYPPSTWVAEFAVAPNGVLWAVTDQGPAQFNGTTWLYANGAPRDITRMAFAPDGTLWLGGQGGRLIHYQPSTAQFAIVLTPVPTITPNPTLFTTPSGPAPSPSATPIPQLPVTDLTITPDGAVWYSFGNLDFHPRGGGIVRLQRGQETLYMPDASVQLLKVAPDGSLWAGMGCGLARFDGQAWQSVLDNCDTLRGNIIDLAFTPDGAAWIATGFKLARYAGGEWTIHDKLASFLAVTPDGALWVSGWEGTQGSQYVARFDGTNWTIVARVAVGQLRVGPDGSLWGVEDSTRLARFDGKTWQTVTDAPFSQINDFAIAPNAAVWVATERGLLQFDGKVWLQDTGASNSITQIAFGPDGLMWLGDWRGTAYPHDVARAPFVTLPTATPEPTLDPSLPTPPPPPTLEAMAGWRIYVNTRYGYSVQYPGELSIVKGPSMDLPDEAFQAANEISFSGLSKPGDPNSGIVIDIVTSVHDAGGNPIFCTRDRECLDQWLWYWNTSGAEVTETAATILNRAVPGIEYTLVNSLYTQTNRYYVFAVNGQAWRISITLNNHTAGELDALLARVLATFRLLD